MPLLSYFHAKGNAYNLEDLPLPPGAYGHNPNVNPWTYDTTKPRALLAEAGYPEGFEVKIITWEAWELEIQIIRRMLERIGLTVRFDVLTCPEYVRRVYIPLMEKPYEEQEWDIAIDSIFDWSGMLGCHFFTFS